MPIEKTAKFGQLRERPPRRGEPQDYVTRRILDGKTLPVIFSPAVPTLDHTFLPGIRQPVLDELYTHGAVLLRGWGVATADILQQVVRYFVDDLVDYRGSAARSTVGDKLYTTTSYPNELEIRLHGELAYAHEWPLKLFFYCEQPAEKGGATPVADSRAILRSIPEEILRPLVERGITYTRTYQYNRPWTKAYNTTSRQTVEELSRQAGRECHWHGDDGLITTEHRPAVRVHPVTGDLVWFNFAHGFHTSRLDDSLRAKLDGERAEPQEKLWPSQATYADGGAIPDEHISTINDVVDSLRAEFTWQRGDILIVDNMLAVHGRRPYTGTRRVLLQIAENYIGDEPVRMPWPPR